MEDKVFELMTKLYSEFSDFRKESNGKFDNIDSKFNRLETEVKGLRGDVIRIENDLSKKVDAALDGYQQVYEKQLDLLSKVIMEYPSAPSIAPLKPCNSTSQCSN